MKNKNDADVCINRGSYMSAHVSLVLFNELGKRDKMRGLSNILSLFATSLINSIIHEHECSNLFIIIMTLRLL